MKEEKALLIRGESKISNVFFAKNSKNLIKLKTNLSEGIVILETCKQL